MVTSSNVGRCLFCGFQLCDVVLKDLHYNPDGKRSDMFRKIKHLIAPPVFDNNEEASRTAYLLNMVTVSSFVAASCYGLVAPAEQKPFAGLAIAVTLIAWAVMKRGYLRAASILLVVGLYLVVAVTTTAAGGVDAPVYGAFIVPILFSGLLLGWKVTAIVTVASILYGAGLYTAESFSLIPESASYSLLSIWVINSLYFLLAGIFLTLALRLIGQEFDNTQRELNERKHAEEGLLQFRKVMDESIDAIYMIDPQTNRYIDFNRSAYEILGYTREELGELGVINIAQHIPNMDIWHQRANLVQESDGLIFETSYQRKDGTAFPVEVSARMLGYGAKPIMVAVVRDITERKQIEAEREKLIYELELRNAESETLRESTAIVTATLERNEAIDRILEQLERVVPYNSASVQMFDGNFLEIVGGRGLPNGNDELGMKFAVDETEPALLVLQGQAPYKLYSDIQPHVPDFNAPPHDRVRAWMAVPLKVKGKVVGVIALDGYRVDQFTERHAQLAATYANQVAIALENSRLFSELQMELVERKRARDEYQTLFDDTPVGIYRSSVDGRMLQANWALTRFNGYDSKTEFLESVNDISGEWYVDPKRRREFQDEMEKNESVSNFESEVYRHKTRERVWIAENAHVVRDSNGQVLYYEGTVENITPRKQAEINLRQRESILEVVADAANLFLKSSDWKNEINVVLEKLGKTINATHAYVFENHVSEDGVPVASMRFEWTADSFPTDLGNPKYINLPLKEEEFDLWYEDMMNALPYIGDWKHLTQEDMDILSERGMKALLDVPIYVDGAWWGIIGFDDMVAAREWSSAEIDALLVASNVLSAAIQHQRADAMLQTELTQRKQLIAELAAKNAELERFTYTVSHDLKSPLFTIRGFLGYLEQDALSGDKEKVKKDTQRIVDATDKMQQLLNDLLELSRIGRLMNEPQQVSFDDLVSDVLALVHGQIAERGVRVQVQENLPSVYGDRQRLIEVLQNLVDNAIKFMGAQSEPCIEIGQDGEQDDMPIFFVRDNGIGISGDHFERIFGLFNKLDPHTDGTGIGLALVKRIIEFHGGRIWVESEANKGSTFYFTLPDTATEGIK